MHSRMFEKINHWYNECVPQVWTKKMVHDAVPKLITAEEYEEITGEPYEESSDQDSGMDFKEVNYAFKMV